MTIDTTRLMKSLFTALTLGVFAIALAAPVALDLDAGVLTAKAAYAKDGADDGPDGPDDNGGHGGDDGPDGPDDNGGHGGDDGAGHK